jgi:ATP-dependent DNA helicase RecG
MRTTPLRDMFIASLPFKLTGGQREVIDDIAADMAQNYPYAATAARRSRIGQNRGGRCLRCCRPWAQGYQAVLVAPTQVLAEQHYRTISAMTNGDSMQVS